MTIYRATIKRVHVDYYTVNIDQRLKSGRWDGGVSYGEPSVYDLPKKLQKALGYKITSMRKDGDFYTVFYCDCQFTPPQYIGRGWYNSQGESIESVNNYKSYRKAFAKSNRIPTC